MLQVKFFKTKAHTDVECIEKQVNDFLKEHADDEIVNIQYTSEVSITEGSSGSSASRSWTAMIIYKQ